MLIEYLYGKGKRYKQLLWFCYGQYIVNNLESNIETQKPRIIQCKDCGEWLEVPKESKITRCINCQKKERSRINRENYLKKKFQTS